MIKYPVKNMRCEPLEYIYSYKNIQFPGLEFVNLLCNQFFFAFIPHFLKNPFSFLPSFLSSCDDALKQ